MAKGERRRGRAMPFAAGVRCHSPLGLLLAATLATLFTAGRSAEFGGSWVGTPTVNISIIAFDENGNSIASGGTSNGEWITFTFTISESVAGGPDPFQASDIWSPTCEHGVNIAMECRFTTIAAGQIYTLTCGTEFASSVDLAINQSSFLDVAGNPNIGTELFTVISDTQGPTLTINATDEYGVDIPDGGARLGHIVFTITADELSVRPGTAGPTGPSGGPPPGFGWYTDSAGQSCDDVCAVAGSNLTCSTDRPGVVDSEASLIAINQCVVARGEAGFSCGNYSEQGHHLMPGQYGDGGQCNYVPNGTTYVRCDGSHPNDHRLCCCIGIGENPSTACPQTPIDCSAPTAVIVTACTSAGQNYAVTGCVADTCTRPSGAAGYDFSAVVETNLEADSFNVTVSVFVFARVRARWPPVLGLASAFVFLIFLVFSWSFLGLRFHSSSLKKTSPASRASPVRPGSPVRQRYQPAQRTGRATRSPAAHRPFTVRSACGSRLGLPSTRAAA